MGHFNVRTRLTGPTGLSEVVELLVDTGATFIVLPRALGLVPTNALAMTSPARAVAALG